MDEDVADDPGGSDRTPLQGWGEQIGDFSDGFPTHTRRLLGRSRFQNPNPLSASNWVIVPEIHCYSNTRHLCQKLAGTTLITFPDVLWGRVAIQAVYSIGMTIAISRVT